MSGIYLAELNGNWKILRECPPPTDRPILIYGYDKNQRGCQLLVKWIPQYYKKADGDYFGQADYCENRREYFWPKGFYEWNGCDQTFSLVEVTGIEITHWQHLPAPPKKN